MRALGAHHAGFAPRLKRHQHHHVCRLPTVHGQFTSAQRGTAHLNQRVGYLESFRRIEMQLML